LHQLIIILVIIKSNIFFEIKLNKFKIFFTKK